MKIVYFAWLRERVGLGEEEIDLPAGIDSVGRLMAWLRTRTPGHEAAFATGRVVRCAVNQNFATPDMAISDGDEVAFFPPVTGG